MKLVMWVVGRERAQLSVHYDRCCTGIDGESISMAIGGTGGCEL